MQLEDYLDFQGPDVIRLKGRRIGLEHIVERFQEGYSPEMIAHYYDIRDLEQLYGVIIYYLHTKAKVNAYLERLDRYVEEQERLADANPSPVAIRLKALQEQREHEAREREERERVVREQAEPEQTERASR
jgi:uncharacterized protein (DUF433 family)